MVNLTGRLLKPGIRYPPVPVPAGIATYTSTVRQVVSATTGYRWTPGRFICIQDVVTLHMVFMQYKNWLANSLYTDLFYENFVYSTWFDTSTRYRTSSESQHLTYLSVLFFKAFVQLGITNLNGKQCRKYFLTQHVYLFDLWSLTSENIWCFFGQFCDVFLSFLGVLVRDCQRGVEPDLTLSFQASVLDPNCFHFSNSLLLLPVLFFSLAFVSCIL